MKKKRLFVAVNLPEGVKNKLQDFQDQRQDFPARWVKPENLHITLNFLGYVEEGRVGDITDALKNVAEKHKPFPFKISHIDYEPDDFNSKQKLPKMIWAQIGESKNLVSLQKSISKKLQSLPFKIYRQNHKFNPHITLCRFNSLDLKNWHEDELPDISVEVEKGVDVTSVELMESRLSRGGATYSVLESIKL